MSETNCTIQWIEIYPVYTAIHLLNNWGLVLNSKGLYQSSGKEKELGSLSCVYVLHKTWNSAVHVVVVQRRQRNVQKSVMHMQSYRFANLSLLLLWRSRCRRRRRCLSSLISRMITDRIGLHSVLLPLLIRLSYATGIRHCFTSDRSV